jgi:hypothetical protein
VRRSVALYLMGEVKPHISLVPGGYLALRGLKGQVPKEKLEIINNHRQPFKVTGVDNDLPDHVQWRLEEIKPSYSYVLEVENISKKAGEFRGHLIVRTDHPQKPELVIIVNGDIREN